MLSLNCRVITAYIKLFNYNYFSFSPLLFSHGPVAHVDDCLVVANHCAKIGLMHSEGTFTITVYKSSKLLTVLTITYRELPVY